MDIYWIASGVPITRCHFEIQVSQCPSIPSLSMRNYASEFISQLIYLVIIVSHYALRYRHSPGSPGPPPCFSQRQWQVSTQGVLHKALLVKYSRAKFWLLSSETRKQNTPRRTRCAYCPELWVSMGCSEKLKTTDGLEWNKYFRMDENWYGRGSSLNVKSRRQKQERDWEEIRPRIIQATMVESHWSRLSQDHRYQVASY